MRVDGATKTSIGRVLDIWEEAVGLLMSYSIENDTLLLVIDVGRCEPVTVTVPVDEVKNPPTLKVDRKVHVLRSDVDYRLYQSMPKGR